MQWGNAHAPVRTRGLPQGMRPKGKRLGVADVGDEIRENIYDGRHVKRQRRAWSGCESTIGEAGLNGH